MDDYVVQLVDHQQYDLKFLDNIDFHLSMSHHIPIRMNFDYLHIFLMAKWLVLIKLKEVYLECLKIKYIWKKRKDKSIPNVWIKSYFIRNLTSSLGSLIRSSIINICPMPPIRILRLSPQISIFSCFNPTVHKLTDPRWQPVCKYSLIEIGINIYSNSRIIFYRIKRKFYLKYNHKRKFYNLMRRTCNQPLTMNRYFCIHHDSFINKKKTTIICNTT